MSRVKYLCLHTDDSMHDGCDYEVESAEEVSRRQLMEEACELLPQETNDEWYQNDFDKAPYRISNNLINTDQYHIGADIQGKSLKIANYDLRPRPPNPKVLISPWNNSTYVPPKELMELDGLS